MSAKSPLASMDSDHPGRPVSSPAGLPTAVRSVADDYRALTTGAARVDRSDRALLVAAGRDRAAWLHNLVTQAIKPLAPGQGVYAFACDVRGRIVFDLNVLALDDVLWLDLSSDIMAAAQAHFDRYLITEDVRLASAENLARIGISGPRAVELAGRLFGADGLQELPPLSHLRLRCAPPGLAESSPEAGSAESQECPRLVRHDFAGDPGFEFYIPHTDFRAWWDWLAGSGLDPVGAAALEARRIERGIPRLGSDLNESVVAPESGQAQRAIHYQKGCYLGQEVIERMRSHNVLARRLVRLELDDGSGLMLPIALRSGNSEVGRITSLAAHPLHARWIGLGYLKSSVAAPADLTAGEPPRAVRALELSDSR